MRWTPLLLVAACWHEPAPRTEVAKPKPIKDLVQPVYIEKQEVSDDGEVGGEVGGDPCGVIGGVIGGSVGTPPPPPPPPLVAPQNVPPTMLEGNRIAGVKQIEPDDVTKIQIERSGKDKLIASFKLCLADTGVVSSVYMLKSSGFGPYDTKIQTEMRNGWRYRPFMVNAKAVPVCTAVTFIYSQRPALPTPPPPRP